MLKSYKIHFILILIAAAVSLNWGYFSGDQDRIDAENTMNRQNQLTASFQTPVIQKFSSIDNQIKSSVQPELNNRSVLDTFIIQGNAAPTDNGGSPSWAMFMNLISGPRSITVTRLRTANTGAAGAPFSIEVFIRDGNALGGPVGSGPGSSSAGWTSIGTVNAVQGSVAAGVSELITLPPITLTANDTVGVAVKFNTVGPRYVGTGTPPLSTYSDTNLAVISGDARSMPFTTTGSFFTSRTLKGEVHYVVNSPTGITNLNTGVPGEFKLSQNYPNPFNPSTNIEFALPKNSNVTLKIYNVSGQEVASLVNGEYAAGTYIANWNAVNMASGIYFYTIQTEGFTQTKKLLLVK